MTYVPRSPRRSTRLRAVVDDGAHHAVGRVRDMSTSGLFLEATTPLAVGRRVAVVPLVGELDGERLPAEVARVGDHGVAIRFIGLDGEHRQRLRQIFSGEGGVRARGPLTRAPLPAIPHDAPVVLLTDEALAQDDADPVGQQVAEAVRELEDQLLELGLRNARLIDDLTDTRGAVDDLERAEDALVREIQRLESLLKDSRLR